MDERERGGLYVAGRPESRESVPLEAVQIEARVTGLASEVRVTQRYRNAETTPIEAVYVFPLDEGAAVCGFEAVSGDRRVVARIEERDEAFDVYDDALADGHGAYLLDQERPNVFTASVGSLPPGATVAVTVRYVAPLKFEGEAVRFLLPTTVSPRYVPSGPPEVGQPDGERVNPERRATVPYGLTLAIEVPEGRGLASIASPSHPIETTFDGDAARVTLATERAALDRDFVLLLRPARPHQAEARVAREEDGTRVVMLNLRPWSLDEEELETGRRESVDVAFVLDCSGSMHGSSIDEARRALALCVRALQEGDRFNVIRFGSDFQSLWPEPRTYDAASLAEATEAIRRYEADLGGTEIRSALDFAFRMRRAGDLKRQILLLTDGQVADEDRVIDLCRANADSSRVFAFGIGAGVSEHMVRASARAGRGAASFIYPGERIEKKVLRMFGRITAPILDDVTLDWGGLDVEMAPARVPPVFAGDALTVFGRVRGGVAERVALVAGGRRWETPIDLERTEDGGPVPTLWAREAIRDHEEGGSLGARRGSRQRRGAREDRAQEELIGLSKRYGLLCRETSFVGVEEREGDEKTTGETALRRIPIALTAGWGGQGFAAQASSPYVTAAMPSPPPLAAARTTAGVVRGAIRSLFGGAREESAAPVMDAYASMDAEDAGPDLDAPAFLRGAPEPELAPPRQRRRRGRDGASEPAAPSGDRLYALLLSQSADGSFPWSDALEEWLGDRAAAARAAAQENGSDFVATALVVALLRRDMDDRADEWRAAASKARAWLRDQPTTFDALALLEA